MKLRAAVLAAVLAMVSAVAAGGCAVRTPVAASSRTAPPPPVRFHEIAHQAGIDFVHTNGAYGRKLMPETVGSGVAWLDYDNDGYQDLLIVNSGPWPGHPGPRTTPHLYHNNGDGTFTDVTKRMGLDLPIYGMGVAVGDYDNDGYEDIYLTAVGKNVLLRNESGKRFRVVTDPAGVGGVPEPGVPLRDKWSTGAAWVDYDRDGRLDLLVCQYVNWSPEKDPWCGHNGVRGYCPPDSFEGSHCTLYHNEGNGRFRDVSKETGIGAARGKSFGIGIADFNGDGWPDIAITNDTWANKLYLNEGGKWFREYGVQAGIAYGEQGKARAGMGIDVGDWRNDGSFSVAIGNFAGEGISLYEGDRNLLFTDTAPTVGIAAPSLLYVTFGIFFFDYDLDGWPDLLATDGHVDDIVNTYKSDLSFREPLLLLHNQRGHRFVEETQACGLTGKFVGRGAAAADFDNDGDLDIAVVDNGGRFRLYRNDGGNRNRWIRIRLEGTRSNRDGIGALVRVTTSDGVTQSQYVHSGGSFLSESQRPLVFGLRQAARVTRVDVHWPSGLVSQAVGLSADRPYLFREGEGVRTDPRFPPFRKGT